MAHTDPHQLRMPVAARGGRHDAGVEIATDQSDVSGRFDRQLGEVPVAQCHRGDCVMQWSPSTPNARRVDVSTILPEANTSMPSGAAAGRIQTSFGRDVRYSVDAAAASLTAGTRCSRQQAPPQAVWFAGAAPAPLRCRLVKAAPHRSATDSTSAATAGSTACSTSPASPNSGSTATQEPT